MSDGAVATVVSGAVTITVTVIGFLTLWVKLKYGAETAEKARVKAEEAAVNAKLVEDKLDHNTAITTEAKDAAAKASEHTEVCDEERTRTMAKLIEHDTRITQLEVRVGEIKSGVDVLGKNLDSTRHEMRGQLQAITNGLQLLSIGRQPVTPAPIPDKGGR